jgi:hypothetical protein
VQEINDLINVLASGIGSLTNASKIEATFKTVYGSEISLNTIRAYIEHLKDAFIISEANRYDVKGRKYIGTPLKYYFEDVGLRNARLGFRQVEETHLMENVIYNELRIRGFQVDVGVVMKRYRTREGVQEKKQLEIDFVANMGSRRYYIQSAFSLLDDEKRAQEKASLINVNDSFKKIIIVKDIIKPVYDDDAEESREGLVEEKGFFILPSNLFFGTSIATCIMVMKKGKSDNKVLFIDATNECVKVTNNNKLTEENIDNIVKLNAEIKEIVAREQVLRDEIDRIIAEIEGDELVENFE